MAKVRSRWIWLGAAGIAATAIVFYAFLPSGPPHGGTPTVAEAETAEDNEALAQRRGALVDQVVFTQESDAGRAAGEIETGAYDIFAQGVSSTTVYQRVRDSQRVAHDVSFGRNTELALNPAGPELATGELNPFYSREIREAMNWLINRRHVAEELFGGLAVPRFLPLSTAFPDYAQLADIARAIEQRYRHDPQRAEGVIRREMEALGAEQRNGNWFYDGQQVRITVLIRTEDARRLVGDYVANLMEDLGFRVERLYRTAEEASRIWIAGDPAGGQWHIYTGGWVAVVINRDQADNFSYFYTPRGRPEPLWQAYDPDPEFDEIADRLSRRDYATLEERQEMMTQALDMALAESFRVWVVDELSIWPRATDVTLAVDLAGGISGSRLWPYTIRRENEIGGNLVFAVPSLLTEPWNPVAGSNWIFDQTIIRALDDPPLLPDPFTGLYWPQRVASAEVTVQEGVPVTRTHDWLSLETEPEIEVPREAWVDWNVDEIRFVTVGEKHPDGVTARTRTRVEYDEGFMNRVWHDGSRFSLADVVMPWILTFERADESSRLFDPAHVPVFETFQRHFRGWHIVSRDPLVIDIYSDQIFPDAETIVAARTPAATPWHLLAAGIRAEQAGALAFSSNKSDRMRVDWMSMVAGPSLAILDRHLAALEAASTIPFAEALDDYLEADEIEERYQALTRWRAERGHFWVGGGPFYLHSVHPVEGSVVARRFEDFPDPSDKWLRFTRPEIPELELDGPLVVGRDESARFELRVTFEGEPYPQEALDNIGYLLFDAHGDLAGRGAVERAGDGMWTVTLTPDEVAELGVGASSIEVAVISNRVALPAFASHDFAVVAGAAPTRLGGAP